jgi:hypothetical protein
VVSSPTVRRADQRRPPKTQATTERQATMMAAQNHPERGGRVRDGGGYPAYAGCGG